MRAYAPLLTLWLVAGGMPQAQGLVDVTAGAKALGDVLAFENEYVRVRYALFEFPAPPRATADVRPVVLFIRVHEESGPEHTRMLEVPQDGRLPRRTGSVSRGVITEILKRPPAVSPLRDPEANPPRGTVEQLRWEGGRLLVATFEPMRYGEGTGSAPSVTTFLSDGWLEVSNRGVRRRFGVQAGDAFWFDARTRLTVLSDDPVGAAIVQIDAR